MVALVRELLSKFMKPEAIPLSAKDIIKVDVRSKDLQLSDKRLSVGRYCYSALNKACVERKIWVRNIYNSLREGYMKSSEFLLKNLPLDNKIITSLSALTPSLIQDDSICGAFITLGEALPNVVAPEEIGQLEEEIRAYQIEVDLVTCAQNYTEEEGRVDVDWWSRVVSMKNPERGVRFPILGQLVKTLLNIFTGPLVEGSFNLMDDILEADRCSMNVETYESLAIVKSTIKAREWTASTMTIDQPLRWSCLSSYQTYQKHLQKKNIAGSAKASSRQAKHSSSSTGPSRPSPTSSGPSRPSPTSSGPSRPSPTSSGPSRPSPTSTGPARPSPTSTGPSRPSPTFSGPSRPFSTSSGPARPSASSSGPFRPFSISYGPAKLFLPPSGPAKASSSSSGPAKASSSSSGPDKTSSSSSGPDKTSS
ncbi:translation initiation factor IF-2 [Labeo rohita]|uniref:Translation initiation factor IF-2 n=1 Tax=Labeo rohita TaxID=84645 RepID=A0A498MAY1_LABRO|nr:translation initiation factor IF-2 [Labeo rohita]